MSKKDTPPELVVRDRNCMNCAHVGAVKGGHVCRRKPGVPGIVMAMGISGPTQQLSGLWLPVTQYDWCGKHKPALQS